MPDQTNGLAFLRWLRKQHPAIKTIVTSGTETDMPLDGYGIFRASPLGGRSRILPSEILATASIPASETGGAKTADPSRKANPAPAKAQPGSVRPNGPPASDEADGRDDDVSMPSMAELSRRLAERAARQRRPIQAVAKAGAPRRPEGDDPQTRVRRQRLVLGFAVGAIACSAVAYLVPTIRLLAVPLFPSTAASTTALAEPVALLAMTAATSTPAPPEPTSPSSVPSAPSAATDVAYTPAVVPASAQTAPAAEVQPAGTCRAGVEPDPARRRDEARKSR